MRSAHRLASERVAATSSRVRLDLNAPEFQDAFLRLSGDDLKQGAASLLRLRQLDWNTLYRHTGFRWEAIETVKISDDSKVYSIRLSQRIRALCYRSGDFLRLISLHSDHDSAYER